VREVRVLVQKSYIKGPKGFLEQRGTPERINPQGTVDESSAAGVGLTVVLHVGCPTIAFQVVPKLKFHVNPSVCFTVYCKLKLFQLQAFHLFLCCLTEKINKKASFLGS